MEKKLYSIKDKVADEFSQPFYCNNDEVAKRIVINSFLSSKDVNLHSCDYFLYSLGSFDLITGSIIPENRVICSLVDLQSNDDGGNDEVH